MKLSYEVLKADYINFNMYTAKRSNNDKQVIFVLRYLIPSMAAVLIFYTGFIIFKQSAIYWLVIALVFLYISIKRFPKYYQHQVRKKLSKIIDTGDFDEFLGNQTLIITDDYIESISSKSSLKTLKSNIKEVVDYKDIILIYFSEVSAIVVPKRDLSQNEISNLLDELKPYLKVTTL